MDHRVTHGTRYAYCFAACRCEPCRAHMHHLRSQPERRAKNAAYMRRYRALNGRPDRGSMHGVKKAA